MRSSFRSNYSYNTKSSYLGENLAILINQVILHFHLHLADAFIQSDLQMRTIEAIKTNKRAIIFKCSDKSRLAQHRTHSKVYIYIINKKKTSNRKSVGNTSVRGSFRTIYIYIYTQYLTEVSTPLTFL